MRVKNKHTSCLLEELLESAGEVMTVRGPVHDCAVTSIEYDSRRVKAGSLFAAFQGYSLDGHRFIDDALARGASAVLISTDKSAEYQGLADRGIAVLESADTRKSLSLLSAAFYGFPSRGMLMVGVTGTNGKTSITYMLESIAREAGLVPGVVGTVNYRWKDHVMEAAHTTPESRDLQEIFSAMRDDGVDAVFMEVSSHALDMNRALGIDFNAVIFTNLTGDHLDFHGDLESYFNAKRKILDLLGTSTKKDKFAVINGDDEFGARLLADMGNFSFTTVAFGCDGDVDFKADRDSISNSINGLRYSLEKPEKGYTLDLKLAGTFHVYNSLAAVSTALSLGIDKNAVARGLARLSTVPGRFDVVSSDNGISVLIDYAHTPDALMKLLESVRELRPRRIITVFGCGGDRDKTKRPVMGGIAGRCSDLAIVTSDNPRTEDPMAIINQIVTGMEGARYSIEPDREKAIAMAVSMAEEGDVVVIAGKGHEDYQIIGRTKRHFDDRETAQKYISTRWAL